ncbi:hypothetical protein [Psychromonas sp. MME2]|uniref:hypothetical protein n=1 Tax=Psychromonas sp. MME2 TaxID=3231033 RepID=UPI00339BB401
MKKILLIAIVAAAGAGAYLFNQQQTPSKADVNNILEYVPADTPIFTGMLDPFPLKEYLASLPAMNIPDSPQAMETLYSDDDPRVNFFLNLFKSYQMGLQNPEQLLKTFGFPDKLRAYFYTLGLLPVFKIEVQDEQALWALLDKNEQETGFTSTMGTLEKVNYRSYLLSETNDPAKLALIVAINNGMLTVTMNSAYQEATLLSTALGLTKVDNSLAQSGKIEQIIKTHDFSRASVGFINHVEIIKGMTTKNANQLAGQITSLEKQFAEENALAELHTPECASELMSIANNWPNTVFGYTQLAINEKVSDVTIATVIESKNQVILDALNSLRGYIPNFANDINNNVFAMGLGIDVSQLGSTLNTIWSDLQTPSFTCPLLAQVQSEISLAGESVTMVSMGTAMVNSMKGLSVALIDYQLNQEEELPILENLDALVTISTDQPQLLFNSLKMFIPQLQTIQLENNGTPVNLKEFVAIPQEYNIDPKLAIKGKHIVIYTGKKGNEIADTLATEQLTANGLYSVTVDFKKMFNPLISAAELAESIPEEAEFLMDYDSRMKMNLDINAQGIIFESRVNSKAAN